MITKIKMILSLLSLSLLLVGCAQFYGHKSFVYHRDEAYLESKDSTSLNVPSDLDKAVLSTYYIIPEVKGELDTSPLPPGGLREADIKVSPKQRYMGEPVAQKAPEQRYMSGPVVQKAPEQRSAVEEKTMPNGHMRLVTVTPPPKTWIILGQGIQRQRIKILNADKSLKTYYILDTFATFGRLNEDTPVYQLHVVPGKENQSSEIFIVDNQGQLINKAREKRLLTSIRKGMVGKKKSPVTV